MHEDVVFDAGRGDQQLEVVLALEPLANDLHVQHAQKATAEAEPECDRAFGLVDERCVVELQSFERFTQQRVFFAVGRIQASKHHGFGRPITGQRLGGRTRHRGDRVAHAHVAHVLEASRDVTHLAGLEAINGHHRRMEDAHLHGLAAHPIRHHAHRLGGTGIAVDESAIRDDALVGVVVRIEDQRPQGCFAVTAWRRNALDDSLEDLVDADALLGRRQDAVLAWQAHDALDLFAHHLRLSAGQVDLVDDGHDLEVVLEGQVDVGERLRFHALRRVDHQQRAFARRQRAGYLVSEVDVTRGIDQVELVQLTVRRLILHAHGFGFDGDALLALEVHCIEHLGHHLTLRERSRTFEEPVGQS